MSGGVDSAVAAALLVEAGAEVIGITLKLWRGEDQAGAAHRLDGCCTLSAVEDARRAARKLGIPHYVLNLQADFEHAVVDDFVAEYGRGRTPNPCVRCNQHIKFAALLERAGEMGCARLATGHYARIEQRGDRYVVRRGVDQAKDQSYVLGLLQPQHLARISLPLGGLTKSETRSLAAARGLELAAKPESQELCFVEDGDYARFVLEQRPDLNQAGDIVDQAGHALGRHTGLVHFTVGQRKGLGIAAAEPLFVTRVDAAANQLVVGPRQALSCTELTAAAVSWLQEPPAAGATLWAQTRAHARPVAVTLVNCATETFRVAFAEPYDGVSPGQLCVLYGGDESDEIIGAGTIT